MSFEVVTRVLNAAVADGAGFTVSYPAGTSSTSFIGARGHRLTLNDNDLLLYDDGAFSVSFDDNDVTITNGSGFTWPAGMRVRAQLTRTAQTTDDGVIEGTDVDFGLDPLGTTASDAGLLDLIRQSSRQKRVAQLLPGRYTLSAHFLAESMADFRLVGGRGVVIEDAGRVLTKASGASTFRLPWGFEVVDCGDVVFEDILFKTVGSGLTGSSSGTFDATNYELRKPVVGFVGCERVVFRRCGHQGNPGQAMDAAAVASTSPSTPQDYAYASLRAAFFNAYQCESIIREDCYLVGDSCAREQISFCDTTNIGWHRERSVSTGENFASLGKVIGCYDVKLGGFYIVDQSSASLVDLIGEDIHFYGAWLDYPAGKAWDMSHEWQAANLPCRNILVENVVTTGRGPTNVGGSSTTEQLTNNPITGYRVRNCQYEVGATDFATDYAPIFQSVVDITTENDVFLNSSPFGRSWNGNGGTGTVAAIRPKVTFTKPSGSLALARRQLISPGRLVIKDADWLQNASLAGSSAGLASFTLGKDADVAAAEIILDGGRYRDASYAVASGVTVEVRNADLTDVAFTFADDTTGKVSYVDSKRNGVPTGNWSAETTTAATKFGTPAIRKEMDDLDAYICALKEIGAWSLIDSTGVLVTGKNNQYLVNLKTPYLYRPEAGGSPVWTRLGGVAGDGSSAWIDLNFGPTTSGINYVQDSAYASVWVGGTNSAEASAYVLAAASNSNMFIQSRLNGDTFTARINDASSTTTANTESRGHASIWRTGSAARAWAFNGTQIGSDTAASTTPPAGDFALFRRNTSYSARTAFTWMIGGGGLGALNADLYYAQRYLLQARGAV